VAYSPVVKQLVLNVGDVQVVSETAARPMARGAARLFHSDLAVSLTGVGGPDGQSGEPPGTVCMRWLVTSGNASNSTVSRVIPRPSVSQPAVKSSLSCTSR